MPRILSSQDVAIADVHPYSTQLRQHNRHQRGKLKKLLKTFGQIVPIVIDKANVILDGHLVREVLLEMGHKTIKVVRVEGLSDPEYRALRLALNRLAQDAAWDNEALKAEFSALVELSFDLELTAFDVAEIDAVLELDIPQSNVDEDEEAIPPLANKPVSRAGDLWLLGSHRLLCGSALARNDLELVMGEPMARMVFTDPPYNIPIKGFVSGLGAVTHREFSQGSGELSEAQFVQFLTEATANMCRHLVDGGLAFICIDWRHIRELSDAAIANKLESMNLCVWTKTNGGMGGLYRSQHELVFVLKHGTAPHVNNVELGRFGRNRSNVWQYRGMNAFGSGRNDLLQAHPTVKPVALVADAIRDVTGRGDRVIDAFLGSGTTLIAAEETGRICHGVEIDPLYVDLAIRRWQTATGRDAVYADTGLTFGELSERALSTEGGRDE